jgi:hypothetical protein
MNYAQKSAASIRTIGWRTMIRLFFTAIFVTAIFAQAQTYTVLHSFVGGADGADPYAGLSQDSAGNLYGTTHYGGNGQCTDHDGCGVVFKLAHRGSGWVTTVLYAFGGQPDGQYPTDRVVVGPDGALYGTTTQGGTGSCQGLRGCGTVFKLQPPPAFCRSFSCPWTETFLYSFISRDDGFNPYAEVSFDRAGNLYGTTLNGGGGVNCSNDGCGTAFQLTPNANGTWTKNTIHIFQGGTSDGASPGGVVVDQAGSVYGTTGSGGGENCNGGCGTAFELTPGSSGWSESLLHSFSGGSDGTGPGQLTFDSSGNIWGFTDGGGSGEGVIFELVPLQGGGATFSVQYTFGTGQGYSNPLTLDANGNIYASAYAGGANNIGAIYSLTRSGSGWNDTVLFSNDYGEGQGDLIGNVARDAQGNIYGATLDGGNGFGSVYELTP